MYIYKYVYISIHHIIHGYICTWIYLSSRKATTPWSEMRELLQTFNPRTPSTCHSMRHCIYDLLYIVYYINYCIRHGTCHCECHDKCVDIYAISQTFQFLWISCAMYVRISAFVCCSAYIYINEAVVHMYKYLTMHYICCTA